MPLLRPGAALSAALASACADDTALSSASSSTTAMTSGDPSTTGADPPATTAITTGMPAPPDTTDAPATSGTSTSGTSTSGASTSGDDASTTGASTSGTSTSGAATSGTSTFETTTSTDEDAVCLSPTDSDTAADPTEWTRSHGSVAEFVVPWQTAVAPDGSVHTSLMYRGQLDLGDGPVDTQGDRYYAVARYFPEGIFAWSAHIATVSAEDVYSTIEQRVMAVDCAGNVIVGGSFTGKLVVQGQVLTAVPGSEQQADVVYPTEDIFLVKFGPDGVRHWARRFGDENQQRIHDLAIQADGTIVIGGASRGKLDLGGPTIVGDDYVGVLAAFDPGGAFVWQRSYASTYDVALLGVSVGPGDVLSVYGHAGFDTDFGGGTLAYAGDPTFVSQFEPDGAHRWSARFFDKKHEPYDLGADAGGGVALAGFYGLRFVARYDDTGQLAWNHDLVPATKTDVLSIMAFTADHEVVIGGHLRGSFDFGGGAVVTPPGEQRPFLARYDLAGNHLASATHGNTGSARAVARGPDGEFALAGSFIGTLDFGDGPLVAVGLGDLFLRRFHP